MDRWGSVTLPPNVLFWMNDFEAASVAGPSSHTKLRGPASGRHQPDRGGDSIQDIPKIYR